MEEFTYLIIGGGMTADAAVRGIREHDMSNRIGIISEEEFFPYNRPPLSKGLWMGKPYDSIWRKTQQEKATIFLGKRAVSINPEKKIVTDHEGTEYSYHKLLLATGGTPKQLSCPNTDVIYFRTLKDYHMLRALYEHGEDFLVIGGGYIGTEIAAALAMNGKKVQMLFKEPSIGIKKLPKKFSLFLNAFYTEKGVQLFPNEGLSRIAKEGEKFHIETTSGEKLEADGVIAGLGISPNTDLAQQIGLNIDNGILVDRILQTSLPDIYAAGDVANFYSPLLEKRMRIEHEDAANSMGRIAGKNMTGSGTEYNYLPFFYSDLFEIGYEAIGEIDAKMEIVEDWHDLYRKGALYYLKDGYLRGALLLGIWNQIDSIREMIAQKQKFSHETLIGKIQI